MKNLLVVFFSIVCFSLAAQDAPLYDEMVFESDSMAKAYKPAGKNYIILKSKRGTDGVNKTSSADSVKAMNITDIVLVFTEDQPGDIATREVANRERWENLIKTYPEFFKENPNLFNTCQCVMGGDAEVLKKSQGFYIFIGGKAETPEPKVVAKKEEPVKAEKKKEEKVKEEKPKKEEKVKEEKVAKEEKVKEEKVKEEKPRKEKKVKEEKPKEEIAKKEEPKEEPVVEQPVVAKPKKQGYAAPKKAKDAKVCRPPCYEGGDEGLNEFLKTALPLSKKQKRHSGDLEATVTLMLNFDGAIKKAIIMSADEEFKKQVEEAVKQMDLWNPAVKGGVTVKSQVKLVLKYDGSSKQIKPFETAIIPRPTPKCTECLSDSQVFGD